MQDNREHRDSIALELARRITQACNESFESGEIWESVSEVSEELLRFWFGKEQKAHREINFHEGQEQAIKSMIYLYECAKVKSLKEIYERFYPRAKAQILHELGDESSFLKICCKMATGTGKTWVMNAFVIWQYLNAIHAQNSQHTGGIAQEQAHREVVFHKNFVIFAPGIIVYERLLDSYCGRKSEDNGTRDIETSDIMRNAALFLPNEMMKVTMREFLAHNVFDKDRGLESRENGFLLLTNWHYLNDPQADKTDSADLGLSPLHRIRDIADSVLPLYPGAKNDLNALDRRFLIGSERKILAESKELCVINDEAHHIYDADMDKEKKWQEILRYVSTAITQNGGRFMQCDFSATPYTTRKIKGKQVQKYFLHIISNFDLKDAIDKCLVKSISLLNRSEIASLEHNKLKLQGSA